MSLHRKRWNQKEKEEILLYSEDHGVSRASREFNVSTATIYGWKRKFDELGGEGLESGAKTALEREVAQLKRENNELKKMVAEKELTIRVKDSLLKKKRITKEEKMMVLDEFLEKDIPLTPLLKILGLPRSTYYYKSTGTKAGKRKATHFFKNEIPVSKEVLLADINNLLTHEFVDYGYYKTYIYLKNELGYAIGSSRTYEIMKENKLLKFQRNKKKKINRN
ncbi:MAG: transposase [Brumimicrobium sp.]